MFVKSILIFYVRILCILHEIEISVLISEKCEITLL